MCPGGVKRLHVPTCPDQEPAHAPQVERTLIKRTCLLKGKRHLNHNTILASC
jgi:hypothetical protein